MSRPGLWPALTLAVLMPLASASLLRASLQPQDDGFRTITGSYVAPTEMELGAFANMDYSQPGGPPVRRHLIGSPNLLLSTLDSGEATSEAIKYMDLRLTDTKFNAESADAADNVAQKLLVAQSPR